ncbi:S locus-related glycoprotein 1 binding pollen coat protein [Arabidopsis suecica]|uniref:S locus-related glycoprotein 1 binding pollen coat protein n=1 Tax=Arabidopsis suecica TaxID=45249 RepID=A0A8T2BAW9_ARASU|nr:S locus-related glycoprotein 1 binding pollen coat protein [Arabidopsis suecica]
MRKSFQRLFTVLTIFIILVAGMVSAQPKQNCSTPLIFGRRKGECIPGSCALLCELKYKGMGKCIIQGKGMQCNCSFSCQRP